MEISATEGRALLVHSPNYSSCGCSRLKPGACWKGPRSWATIRSFARLVSRVSFGMEHPGPEPTLRFCWWLNACWPRNLKLVLRPLPFVLFSSRKPVTMWYKNSPDRKIGFHIGTGEIVSGGGGGVP